MKRYFKAFYNDGAYAMDITFTDKDNNFIESSLQQIINEEFNNNTNPIYHITRNNIKEI